MKLDAYEKWLCEKQWNGYPLHRVLDCALDDYALDGNTAGYRALRSLSILGHGLMGEAGEAGEHFKKYIRDYTIDKRAAAIELGDVLAYLTWLAKVLDYSLEDIAQLNYDKLMERGRKDS